MADEEPVQQPQGEQAKGQSAPPPKPVTPEIAIMRGSKTYEGITTIHGPMIGREEK